MAANPALIARQDGTFLPAPFQGEYIALARPGVEFSIDNIRSRSGKWSKKGTLWLTNLRIVLVAEGGADRETGLRAFEVPLSYISRDVFNQPIFTCNNLAGRVWQVPADDSPPEDSPPHQWVVYFKEGGVGTFLPMYYNFLAVSRGQMPERPMGSAPQTVLRQEQQQQNSAKPSAPPAPRELVATAFQDPGDPSKVYLAQPVLPGEVLPCLPVYAASYGQEEKQYESTGLRP